ncbi:MAG: hypothetical protein A3H98_07290 [Bacteroidetes bacterium RIFCSPLOWO2_02_FULL_36_8]|nr:MAG: hypothetical protein A3H98_07290 [Bacteroidetes bacterium RIFCSPLOWO2_02_FULL_36_8]OFY69672.1 MAG: hypothetical protein A3G23_14175 [Bacteroidetes bacterium RIFCSPLOWO2_12_FULL_37_12]
MELKSHFKIDPAFSLASMTDMIFLLLIFFLLTSTVVTPSGLTITLPTSKTNQTANQKVTVSITDDLGYYLNGKKITASELPELLRNELPMEGGTLLLQSDKTVPIQYIVEVADMAKQFNAKIKIVLATKPGGDRN